MQISVMPMDRESVARAEQLCAALGVGAPRFWRWDDLHATSADLLASGSSHLPVDYAIHRQLANLRQDVLVMSGGSEDQVRAVMAICRDWPMRPIYAVTTRHSVAMSLAVLLEHLQFDRNKEDRKRQAARAAMAEKSNESTESN